MKLGDLVLNSDNDGAQPETRSVVRSIIHPDYKRTQIYNDIGLLILNRRVDITPFIYPVCLPNTETKRNNNDLIITGWGRDESRKNSDKLRKALVEKIPDQDCQLYYKDSLNRGFNHTTQMCAGSTLNKSNTNYGDSGGPIQIKSDNCTYTIIGVTNFGFSSTYRPSIYVRVEGFLDWITNIVSKYEN